MTFTIQKSFPSFFSTLSHSIRLFLTPTQFSALIPSMAASTSPAHRIKFLRSEKEGVEWRKISIAKFPNINLIQIQFHFLPVLFIFK